MNPPIPMKIVKNKKTYVFVKKYPYFYQYKDIATGFLTSFTKFDLD